MELIILMYIHMHIHAPAPHFLLMHIPVTPVGPMGGNLPLC